MIDLTGQIFGRLTVISTGDKNKRRMYYWICRCDCGKVCKVRGDQLRSGGTKSCGCLHIDVVTKHGYNRVGKETNIYRVWSGMLQRCLNPNHKFYDRYGGRGIKVCDRWLKFENFLADVGEAPAGKSLDRIDNDGDYAPNNYRWATRFEQMNNMRDNVIIHYDGKTMTASQWARNLGMPVSTLYSRLKAWSVEDSLTRPVRGAL
jgi:hypothetical protein